MYQNRFYIQRQSHNEAGGGVRSWNNQIPYRVGGWPTNWKMIISQRFSHRIKRCDIYIHTHTPSGILLIHKKKNIFILSKINIVWYHLHVESNYINKLTKQKQYLRLWKQAYGYQSGKVGGINYEFAQTYTLLYIK